MRERRKSTRVPLNVKILVVFPGVTERKELLTQNLSEGGLFLESEKPRPVGTKLSFEFLVHDGGPPIEGIGLVQWIETDPEKRCGMGIRFTKLNDAGREEIATVLRERNTSD